jgi:low temperature requirement protein LtrA
LRRRLNVFSQHIVFKQHIGLMNIARIAPPRLRTKEQEDKRTATWLELFYDLAFVVGVAVLSGRLLGSISPATLASYFAYFALLWWLWASHTYYADRYDTDDLVYRLLAAGQMFAVVVMAAALAGDTTSTAAFAVGYAVARWLLVAMYWRAYRHVPDTRLLVRGYLIGFGAAALLWTAAIFVPDQARFVVWAVALGIDLATPWVMRREQAKVPLDVSHLPERFGLFTILVLGESISAVVTGLAHASWTGAPIVASAGAIGVATAFWWMYFDNARGRVVRRDPSVRRTWRPTAWLYTHLPLAASLASMAVALERAINEAGHLSMHLGDRWFLVGSAAVVLASMALIQFASSEGRDDYRTRGIVTNRLLGIPVVLLFGLLSSPEPQWIVIGVLGVAVAELVGDIVIAASTEDEVGSE